MRTLVVLVALAAVVVVAANGQTVAIGGIHLYQRVVSPLATRAGVRCRFTPTCSRYAEIVIARDGTIVGGWETLKRIARCGPWTPMGTRDDP